MQAGSASPKVSLGVTVYNSEPTRLRRAMDGLLAQTLDDFEVIICDNSTLDTPQGRAARDVCLDYTQRDARVRYDHNQRNLGATGNFMRTLAMARGAYFKWVADDDKLDPTYLEACAAALDDDPTLALCYTRIRQIKQDGSDAGEGSTIVAMDEHPGVRFVHVLCQAWSAQGLYGLFRTDVLRRLHPYSYDSIRNMDIAMLCEASLYGRIRQLDETLFTYTVNEKPWDDREELNARMYRMCSPEMRDRGITFPNIRLGVELIEAVRHCDLPLPDKQHLYDAIPKTLEQIISGYWNQEIQRAVRLVFNKQLFLNWGDTIADTPSEHGFDRIPAVYRVHAARLLQQFDEVLMIWPTYPGEGLQAARAVLLAMLGRLPEAQAALHVELARHPAYEPARQLLRNLNASAAQSRPA